jgi:hypothetical protein
LWCESVIDCSRPVYSNAQLNPQTHKSKPHHLP